MNTQTINNIINHINRLREGGNRNSGICVLLGAGADISSGGILFRELKIRFLRNNGHRVPDNIKDQQLDTEFEEQVNALSQDGRCETLSSIMREHKAPSEGYLLMVMLAQMGYINAVITTNFDYLLEESQELLNLKPFTIFAPGKAVPAECYPRRRDVSPIYLKMHGDLHDGLVTHLTQNEIQNKQYGKDFIELFRYIIQNYSIIVVGYGGYDSLITEIFNDEIDNINDVYWCNISKPQTDSNLVNLLNDKNKLCYVETSFDRLFQTLAQELLRTATLKNANPVFLPTVVQSKIEHQKSLFETRIGCDNNLISRIDAHEKLSAFLGTFSNKCIFVTGECRFGKSCFIYEEMQTIRDITFLPIFPTTHDCEYSILQTMACALGYDTDVPFSVMYSFLKWWDEKDEQLVFILDDFFNQNYYQNVNMNYVIEFFNFIYAAQAFKHVQFVICFQSDIYNQFKETASFSSFKNIISAPIKVGEFSDDEVIGLLNRNNINDNIDLLKAQKLLHIPYVWEIIHRNHIVLTSLTNNTDFFAQYTNAIYKMKEPHYNFTKYAFNLMLKRIAYNQVFSHAEQVDIHMQEYTFLREKGIIDEKNKIIYPELAIHFCKQYFTNLGDWKNVIHERIIPDIQSGKALSNSQLEVYASVLTEGEQPDKYNTILGALETLVSNEVVSDSQKKVITKVLQKSFQTDILFREYLHNVDINTLSVMLQRYIFKVCAELHPEDLINLGTSVKNSKLSYAAFILTDDLLYNSLKEYSKRQNSETKFLEPFTGKIGLIRLWHILTYWGWDNLTNEEYAQLANIITNKVLPMIIVNENTIQYTANTLTKYAYSIFFNTGTDFIEKFSCCIDSPIMEYAKNVLNNKSITSNEYKLLLETNTDINNSWLFILSNVIVVQAMRNQPDETYDMLYHFWDNMQSNVLVQYLDFFLSSTFWSLYLNVPCDREKFTTISEKVIEKYERILFKFPEIARNASINKFSEEFDRMFEDGFNPIAIYFYTAPYKSLTSDTYDWNNGKDDLKIYWDLTQRMSTLGKYNDILRIVHALGQMISIYPKEGYSALKNLTNLGEDIIHRGILRIFKENYLRYSEITKTELENPVYQFTPSDIEEIIYNTDFLLENRTLEQLHWSRLFYNLEQILDVNVSELFLSTMLYSRTCPEFLQDFIKGICEKIQTDDKNM